MDFTSQDITVIEQALRIAMRSQPNESHNQSYREVLSKLQANAHIASSHSQSYSMPLSDGVRFDYDDSSDF